MRLNSVSSSPSSSSSSSLSLHSSETVEPEADGEIEVRVNGQTVIDVRGVVLRTSPLSTVQGLHVQSFFGGEYFCVFRVSVLLDEEEECAVR